MCLYILHVVNHPYLKVAAVLACVCAAVEPTSAKPVRIAIDPGHGGTNHGAQGAVPGETEKAVTLAIARQVALELRASGLEVVLTRTVDCTMTLRQRAAVANRQAADLFVSIHANASPTRSQRGFETYVLTPSSIDETAPRNDLSPDVSSVLDDIERGAAQWESADLAAAMQSSLRAVRGRSHDRGVRQDAQHVLLGATMPAVLVEIGFIDHPVEGVELSDHDTQTEMAKAIATAIRTQVEALAPTRTAHAAEPRSSVALAIGTR
jgi:N-acetylmuramoyl-L-alanine amidase